MVALLFLLACPLTLASDAARITLPSGMNRPLTIRYPELAQAPAPALIGEGLQATYEMVAGSPEVVSGRGDVAYTKGDYEAGLVQIDVVALENGQAATWTAAFKRQIYIKMLAATVPKKVKMIPKITYMSFSRRLSSFCLAWYSIKAGNILPIFL